MSAVSPGQTSVGEARLAGGWAEMANLELSEKSQDGFHMDRLAWAKAWKWDPQRRGGREVQGTQAEQDGGSSGGLQPAVRRAGKP